MRAWLVVVVLLVGVAGLGASPGLAQDPSADWRTLETDRFRFHYPAPAEAWTRRVAARMEAVRTRVAAEVGHDPAGVTDVLVIDPLARPNGSAWPVLGRPRMLLYTTPPAADSVLGHYRDWGEVLTVHEDVHLAHLLRPSRQPLRRLVESLLPIGPIPGSAPRWVVEGYATTVEGRLTGWGRPHGALRAALLRRWAQAGELPSYGALSGDGRRWLGLSMPYLVGSAFLEWLEARGDEGSLRRLWARMTARQSRSFEEAFRGVFGESPARLYRRFTAELTYRAMALEQAVEPRLEIGEPWQDLDRRPSAPAVDRAGEHLAMVLRSRGAPARLVVWSTAENAEARERFETRQAALVERDPDDFPAVAPEVFRREPAFVLEARHGADPYAPRWSADGEWLLFHRFEVDEAGDLRPDLFRWWPRRDRLERLTRGADVRDADPAPGGGWAVALRHRWGASQLVRVDLESGAVTPLTEAGVEDVYGPPRLDPAGTRVTYVVHRQDGWRLATRSLDDGVERRVPLEVDGRVPDHVAHPAWSLDGREVVVTLGVDGFLDLFAVEVPGDSVEAAAPRRVRRLTRSHGAALAPAPTTGGDVFFLALESDGFDLRRLPFRAVGPAPEMVAAWPTERWDDYVPAVPPRPRRTSPLEVTELDPPRPYGAGPGEWLPLVGGAAARDSGRFELGVRYGDPVGRLDVLALGAVAEAGIEGGALAAVWRGLPVRLEGRLFALDERIAGGEDVRLDAVSLGAVDIERRGVELALHRSYLGRPWSWGWRAGLLAGELEDRGGDSAGERFDQGQVFAGVGVRGRQRLGDWRFAEDVNVFAATGETSGPGGDDGFSRADLRLRLEVGWLPVDGPDLRLGAAWRRSEVRGARHAFDRLVLGGTDDSLSPRSLAASRFFVPAMPAGFDVGERGEHQRLDLHLGRVVFFGERYRLWNEQDANRGEWTRLAGLEWRLDTEPFPLLALPALHLEAGVAYLFDPPFEDDVEGWLVLRWRP